MLSRSCVSKGGAWKQGSEPSFNKEAESFTARKTQTTKANPGSESGAGQPPGRSVLK